MFTGLVESVATVEALDITGDQATLILNIEFADELSLGDSVAINGCCLTVEELLDSSQVAFHVLEQTLKVTSLGDLGAGSLVNVERAMLMNARLGGHIVQGHVDAIGKVVAFNQQGEDWQWSVEFPDELADFIIHKGSITVDGMSLTVAELDKQSRVITIYITPHTYKVTHLPQMQVGKVVNLEADLIAKYVQNMVLPYQDK